MLNDFEEFVLARNDVTGPQSFPGSDILTDDI
jgi:hypothetical protein